MAQHYSDPRRENDRHALPNVEIFYIGKSDEGERCPLCPLGGAFDGGLNEDGEKEYDHTADHIGWYWWSCFPGCMPDSDPNGPFATEAEALADAQEGYDDDGSDD